MKQRQKAGANSKQMQNGKVLAAKENESVDHIVKVTKSKIIQRQKGGNSSIQNQVGGVNDER